MEIGVSTLYGLISKSALEAVDELERAGFKTVELVYEYDHFYSDEEIKKLSNKDLNLSMHCPFVGIMFCHPNLKFAEPQIQLVRKSLEVATKIGCSHYVIHGGRIPKTYFRVENPKSRDYFIDLFIERFKDLFEKYSKQGLKILIENLTQGKIGDNVGDIRKIQKSLPEVGFCFDIAHSQVTKTTEEFVNEIKVDYVHVTDNNLEYDDHKAVGKGKINFREIFSKLKNKGFDGKVILENLSLEECKRSANNLKEVLK